MHNQIVCLVGESGSGKSTIAQLLEEQYGYTAIPSYTTRPPRNQEEKGHIFVSQEEFDTIRADLVAYTKFSGAEYGATRQQIEQHDIYIIDPAGVEGLAKHIGRENMTVIYIRVDARTRRCRMEFERGFETARERVAHDIGKFAGFDDYDISLRNETRSDLERNVFLIHQQIEYARS
jgi:guanylate kinase